MPTTTPGALPEDWAHLQQKLGLGDDLLPVVSNLKATISPKSKLQSLGKLPSLYNNAGEVVGVKEWTTKVVTDRDIARWARNPDIGILIRTGKTTGICVVDIDINDPVVAQRIEDMITAVVGELPMRGRSNSGKRVLMFRMPGQFTKRIIHTAHGNVEFLATGQQFVAVGTHPSGARYEWRGGLPEEIPELTPAEFFAVWQCLQNEVGIEPEGVARGGLIRTSIPRAPSSTQDDTAAFLDGNGWIRSYMPDGRINIDCPFKDEHTTDSGETETQYFPAGVGGFAQGHFKCMHAHCAGRTDADFIEAIGLMQSEFEDLTQGDAGADGNVTGADGNVTGVPAERPALPAFTRKRNGEIKATLSNVLMALARPDVCKRQLGWDTFRDELMWASEDGALDWRAFQDHDYTQLRVYLERNGFDPIGRDLIRDAVRTVAWEHQFDSAQVWLEGLPAWDGTPRARAFFHRYMGAEDTPYTQACGLYAWSAHAARVMDPGCQADMAFILKSRQGTRKTSGIRAISPSWDAFAEFDLSKHDDSLARGMRGVLVAELSELRGMNSRESESIKAWVSRRYEKWIPKYQEFATTFPRRFLSYGSTNEQEVLADSTGERRWLPMEVGEADVDAIERDREQLWAEGLAIWREKGIQYAEAERLAKAEHIKFKVHDPWLEPITTWLREEKFGDPDGKCNGDFPVRICEILQGALGKRAGDIARKDELRVSSVLRALGHTKGTVREGSSTFKAWSRPHGFEDIA